MKLEFRQGLVRFRKNISGNPDFLRDETGGEVTLLASRTEALWATLAQEDLDYLHREESQTTNAWSGFPNGTQTYWLYIDLNVETGVRTFDYTDIEPVVASRAPSGAANGTNWFDTRNNIMKERVNNRWIERIRVFVGERGIGANSAEYDDGTQVGVNTTSFSGEVLFDEDSRAIRRVDRFRRGRFFTTESPISTLISGVHSLRLAGLFNTSQATEVIPRFYCVARNGANEVGIARRTLPNLPAVGVSSEEMSIGESRAIISEGYLSDNGWNWTEDPGTPLWVGDTGELTTTVPQFISMQRMGHVVDDNTIYLDVEQIIFIETV